jgi:hypothetical protein
VEKNRKKKKKTTTKAKQKTKRSVANMSCIFRERTLKYYIELREEWNNDC